MSANHSHLPLLDTLLALKPNAIFAMGRPKEITAAAKLFAEGCVESFRWGQSGRLLEARLRMEGNPRILFMSESGQLVTSAQPSDAHISHHVLAALMTIMRVLHGSKWHTTNLSEQRVERFREELRAPEMEAARPKVMLTCSAPGQPCEFDYDTGKRESSWRIMGPPKGMDWLVWQQREPELVAEGFCRWIATKPELDIELRTVGHTEVVSGARSDAMRAMTRIQHLPGEVVIERTLVGADEKPISGFIDLGHQLAFVPETNTFVWVDATAAWRELRSVAPATTVVGEVRIPTGQFWMAFPEKVEKNCFLEGVAGMAGAPSVTGCRPALHAVAEGARVLVSLRVKSDSGHDLPAAPTFLRALEELFLDGPFALLVSGAGRRRRLADFLARGMAADSLPALVAEAESDPAFTSRAMHGEDAGRCLRQVIAKWTALDGPHLATGENAGAWVSATGAGRALTSGFAAFVGAFPGEDPLRVKGGSFEVDALRFFGGLPALVATCEAGGVELRVNDRSTRLESLRLSVRILATGEIDWFELHPEARAGALAIPTSQWEQVLRSGHHVDEDGTLVSFDSESLALLGRMAGLMGDERRVPRLGLFDWLALRGDGVACELPAEDAAVLDSLQSFESIPRHPLPPNLEGVLRDYQHQGYDWLCFLYAHRFGACLADDMGLGKTLQAIALLAALCRGLLPRERRLPHLVVLPPTLLFNWQNELQRFAPELVVHEYLGPQNRAEIDTADVVLTTYERVRRDVETLAEIPFDVIVFDEAQALKNFAAARTRAAERLKARFRLCLTGTPLENHVGEFHSIMEMALPGIFGSRQAFIENWEAGKPVLDRVRPFLLRRTKAKILSELPPKTESDSYLSLSDAQRECYTRTVAEVREEVRAAFHDRPGQQAGLVALTALMRLRQVCISPRLLSPDFDGDSPKISALVEQLAELADEGHAALVFSQFLGALDLTGKALDAAGLAYLRLDGSTPRAKRKELIESFQSGDAPGIFLISLKTGGTGLTLTRASYVFHLDPWWNPAVENQASDRAHRIGQTKGVFVQRLLMRHTVEEKMMTLKHQKQLLFTEVVEKGTHTGGPSGLTSKDFDFLLDAVPDAVPETSAE